MKYTKYHNKKKSQPITKIVRRLLTICCTTRWRFQCGYAVQGKWKSPPPPSMSINDVTLQAALEWNFAILEVKTDLAM